MLYEELIRIIGNQLTDHHKLNFQVVLSESTCRTR